MGLHGRWYCLDCKVSLMLGKFLRPPDAAPYFDTGEVADFSSAKRTRALWRLLAEHHGHDTKVFVEGLSEPAELDLDKFKEIGGDREEDLSIDDYLRERRK